MAIMFSNMLKKNASAQAESGIYADLHIHSTASDGAYSPADIAAMLNKRNIMVAALTDHDTFSGYKEFAAHFNGTAVPGVELSVSCCSDGIHLLAYGFDPEYKPFVDKLKYFDAIRESRIAKMCKKLQDMGIQVSLEDVKELCDEDTTLGRPHVARVLLAKGYIKTFNEAFYKYIGDNKPAYVEKERMTIEEGISIIHEAGGIAVIAHPGLYQPEIKFEELEVFPVDGYEVYHPNHTHRVGDYILSRAKENKILVTGGSDFHDLRANKSNVLAIWGINMDYWLILKKHLNKHCFFKC